MGILNWLAAKAVGVPTVDENCKTGVLVFLGQNDITEPKIEMFRGEPSGTNSRFFRRVYVGHGRRNGVIVHFILDVNEDIVRPHGLMFSQQLPNMSDVYREWRSLGEYRGSLFHFFAEKFVGTATKLEAR